MNKEIIFFTVAFLIAFVFVSTPYAQKEWIAFAPPGGNYSVMMPGTPETEVKNETGNFGPYTVNGATLVAGDEFYIVVYVDYAPTLKLNVQGEINANRDNFIKGVKGAVLTSEKKITIDGHPGLEFTADVGTERYIISRIYLVGRRPYQLVAATRKKGDMTNANKFLNSFKLLK